MENTTVKIGGKVINIQEWVNEYCHPWTNAKGTPIPEAWETCDEIHVP